MCCRSLAIALLSLALWYPAGAALAHIPGLEKTEPPDGGVLCTSARRIAVRITSELDVKESRLTLEDPGAQEVGQGGVDLNDINRRSLILIMAEPPPPGGYTVYWRAVSNDDKEIAEGSFQFTAQDCPGLPWWAYGVAGAGVAVAGAAMLLRRRPRPN